MLYSKPVVFVDAPKIDLFALPKAFVLPENKLVPDVPLFPNKLPVVPLVPNPPKPPRDISLRYHSIYLR